LANCALRRVIVVGAGRVALVLHESSRMTAELRGGKIDAMDMKERHEGLDKQRQDPEQGWDARSMPVNCYDGHVLQTQFPRLDQV
jgi:hypothetical protein